MKYLVDGPQMRQFFASFDEAKNAALFAPWADGFVRSAAAGEVLWAAPHAPYDEE